jgi:hypothetical protein
MTRTLIVVLMVLCGAGVAGADFKVVQATHQDGFSMMGQNQPAKDEERTTWIGDKRMRMDQGDTSTIVLLNANKMFILNHDQKSYYEIDLPIDLAAMLPPGMGDQMMQMMKFDVTITPSDETKEVNGWAAKRYDMQMKSAMLTMDSVLWASTETPIDASDYVSLYGEVMSLQPGTADMIAKMRQIEGFVVAQETSMTMSMMGDSKVRTNETTTAIEEAEAPAGTYGPPEGYTKSDLDYMKMMQR